MTFNVRICSYPNNETRATLYYSAPKRIGNLEEESEPEEGEVPHLTLSKKMKRPTERSSQGLNSSALRPGYGALGRRYAFSTYARRQLLRCGSAMDKEVPASECLFLTGTCPGSTAESWEAMAKFSSWIVHRVKAWVAKRQSSKLDFYVWEFQKRGALHLHYAVHIANENDREYIKNNWKKQWIGLITRIGTETQTDMWRKNKNYTHCNNKDVTQADAQVITKSVGRYLSKYLSKATNNATGFAMGRRFAPTRWYGVSRSLLSLTASLTRTAEKVFGTKRQALAFFESVKTSIEGFCNRVHLWQCPVSLSQIVFGYTESPELLTTHPVIKEIMNEQTSTPGQALNLRQLLIMSGIILIKMNGRFSESFMAILGDCAWARYKAIAAYKPLPIAEQIAFIEDCRYVCIQWQLNYQNIPIACSNFLRNYRSWSHLLSDGDGEIAPMIVESGKEMPRIVDLKEESEDNAVRHFQPDLW